MDKDLHPKILDSNSVWTESQSVRKCPNQEIGGPLRRLIYQIYSLEDVKIVGRRLDQGFGDGWKHSHDVLQQKSQRSMTKMFLVPSLLIVPLSAIRRRLALIGRRIVLEPTPLKRRSITPLVRRMPKRTRMGIVGSSPRWTSVCRVIFWMRRTWLDMRSSSEENRRTIPYMDQRMQGHLLDAKDLAGQA